jgi:hypothetical protein
LDFSTHRNCEILHFPTALGADVPIYNVPGVSEDRLLNVACASLQRKVVTADT